MSFLNGLKAFKEAATSGLDRALTAAEERTPNLDDFKPREYGDNELRPRNLNQGDNVIAEHIQSGELISGMVFTNDRRNELVIVIVDNGEQGIVKWSDAKFYDADADPKQNKSSGGSNVRSENMEEGVIYDGEIID